MTVQSDLSAEQTELVRAQFLAGATTVQLAAQHMVARAVIQRAVRGLAKQQPPSAQDVRRFWSNVDQSGGPSACWRWIGGQAKGRGQFYMQRTTHQAHRVAYRLTYGPIPPGQVFTPECGDWLCVNPDHWIMEAQPVPHVQGAAHGQAKLDDAQVAAIRERRAAGGVTLQALADHVGVNESTIRKYVRGQRRRDAPGPIAPAHPQRRNEPPTAAPRNAAHNAPRRHPPARQPRTEPVRPVPSPAALRPTNQGPHLDTPAPAHPATRAPQQPSAETFQRDRTSTRGGPRDAHASPSTGRPRILVAAIDDLATLALDTQLQALGYPIIAIARHDDDAISLIARLHPDLILLDRRLADQGRLDLIERLTTQPRVPIIVLDTRDDRRALRRAVAAGAFGYLGLPTSVATLEATITVAMARATDLANLRDQVRTLAESLAARKVIAQAKGILMRRHDLDERAAYARLREYARDRRVTMQEVAAAVIEADRHLGT